MPSAESNFSQTELNLMNKIRETNGSMRAYDYYVHSVSLMYV